MKLKTIAKLFKKNKYLTIYTAPNGEQWLCNGYAMYSMRGMPNLSPENVLRIFDIPPDKHSDWICKESETPTTINFEDHAYGEIDVEPLKISIGWHGDDFTLFQDENRIYSFNKDFIEPLLDEPDYLTFHKRNTANGAFVLACKVGFEIKAIICPALLHTTKQYAEQIKLITSLYDFMERERVVDATDEFHYESSDAPDTDPETGEVIEE